MAITSFAELKTAIANWTHRADISTTAGDLVMLGEWRIYRELRIRAMEASLSATVASGVIAVPSDYVELKNAYVDGSPVQWLERKSAEYVYRNYDTRSSDGKPCIIAREAGNFIFGPYPDSAYVIKGIYYKRLPALSDANTSNWFIVNAPDLLLFASLAEAAPFINNRATLDVWEAKYEQARAQVMREDRREGHSGSILAVTPG